MTPLFDSLAHPTLSGKWLNSPHDAGFASLDADLSAAGFIGACATGIHGVEDYDHHRFIAQCARFPRLLAIAGLHPESEAQICSEIALVRQLGYTAIKIHPRFSRIRSLEQTLTQVLVAASEADLPVYYCTYLHADLAQYPLADPLYALVAALKAAPRARVVLLHGGDVQLMRYAELVRFNPNLLLDLSMTICKYAGSSLDQDIGFLFRSFDRRICIGSDHPEWSHVALRKRFDLFSEGLAQEKKDNVGHRNLLVFLGRTDLLP